MRTHTRIALASALGLWVACSEAKQGPESSGIDGFGASDVPAAAVSVTILSPQPEQVIGQDEPVSFLAQITHQAPATLQAQWESDRSGVLSTAPPGTSGSVGFTVASLAVGAHVVTLGVKAPDGAAGSASVHFVVNAPPGKAAVSIAPLAPTTDDTLEVHVDEPATDRHAQGGAVSYRYRWFVDGEESPLNSDNVPATETAKAQVWRVEVTAFDGWYDGDAATAQVTIQNSPPVCDEAMILPSAGGTLEAFKCQCKTWEDADPEDAAEPPSCEFLVDGEVLGPLDPGADPCQLDPALTERGMALVCRLRPNDGETLGDPVENPAPALVLNTPPTTPAVLLDPPAGTVSTPFSCTTVKASTDADGDPVTYGFSWKINEFKNDQAVTQGIAPTTLVDADGSAARRGDALRCVGMASDGFAQSKPAESAPVILGNAAPEGGAVQVTPPAPTEDDVVSCIGSGALDPDGDPVTWLVTWLVDGVVVPGQTGPTLDGAFFDKGQVVTCLAAPTDGEAQGKNVLAKNQAGAVNTLPSLGSAWLSPKQAGVQGAFGCSWEGWNDPDPADPAQVAFQWYTVDAEGAETLLQGEQGATLLAKGLPKGTTVRCLVVPYDSEGIGALLSADGQVVDSAPSVFGVTLGPEAATATSTLECLFWDLYDPDPGDAVEVGFAWFVNQVEVPNAAQATLQGAFAKGDSVTCQATPLDGELAGEPGVSAPLLIGNLPPAVGVVLLAPASGTVCATYTCQPQDVVDLDPVDAVDLVFRWEKNGSPLAGAGDTLAPSGLTPGDTLRCHVTPHNPGEPEATAEVGSNLAVVGNQAPSVATVTLSEASIPFEGSVQCLPQGFADECATTAAYTYAWLADGAVIAGAAGAKLETAGLDPGTAIACRVQASDGFASGAPVTSDPASIANVPPTAPVVQVTAPGGADAPVTCSLLFEAESAPGWEITYTYHWEIGSQPSFVGPASLAADQVSHCDRIRCWATASDGIDSVDSPPHQMVLPLGTDCDDANVCTKESCALPGGGCAHAPAAGPCEDGNACTAGDACAGASCAAGPPTGCDDLNPCTEDGCHPKQGCYQLPFSAGTPCDDENLATKDDQCDFAATCAGTPYACPLEACMVSSEPNGASCDTVLDEDGAACEDGDGCTTLDACLAGVCEGGPPVVCLALDACHEVGACDPGSGACTNPQAPSGTPCDDGDLATKDDQCQSDAACEGTPFSCEPGPCEASSVPDGSGCEVALELDGTGCDDDDPCTTLDVCAGGQCEGGAPVVCLAVDGCHLAGTCDAATGLCSNPQAGNGTNCDGGLACTLAECQAGVCTSSGPATDGSPCQDGEPCTQDDTCQGGACTAGGPVPDGSGCDDGLLCSPTSTCQAGACKGAPQKVCKKDGTACVDFACDLAGGLTSRPVAFYTNLVDGMPGSGEAVGLASRPVAFRTDLVDALPWAAGAQAFGSRPVAFRTDLVDALPWAAGAQGLGSRPVAFRSDLVDALPLASEVQGVASRSVGFRTDLVDALSLATQIQAVSSRAVAFYGQPRVTGVAPLAVSIAQASYVLALSGVDLASADAVSFHLADGSGVPATGLSAGVPSWDGQTLLCTLTLDPAATPGLVVVTVETPDGDSPTESTLTNLLQIDP